MADWGFSVAGGAARPGWRPNWPILSFLLLGLTGLGVFLLPGSAAGKLTDLMTGICPQRLSHSVAIAGRPLPLEARMAGIFGGFLATFLAHCLTGRGWLDRWGRPWVLPLVVVLLAILGLDGTNALARDLGLPTPYPPNNWVRLATGLLAGFGLALLLPPIVAGVVRATPADRDLIAGPVDLVPGLAAGLALFAVVVGGAEIFYYPVSWLVAGGVVAVIAAINLMVVQVISGHDGRTSRPFELAGWLALATTIALIELTGLGLLRTWATIAFNLRWEPA